MAEDRDKQSMGTRRSLSGGSLSVTYQGTAAGWFDPLKPMEPMAPPSIKGRILDFPTGYNRNIQPKAYEPITFAQLRGFADSYDLLRLVIETRKDQVAALRWNIVAREHAKDKANDKSVLKRIEEIKKFFIRPDQVNFWDEWLRMILEDLFVLDAPAVYRRRTYGGDLYALEPIDGGTIKRVIDQWGRTPPPPEVAYQQVLKGFPALDYTTEDLIYRPRNLRTHKVYGYSPVEQIVMTVNIGIRRQVWQLQSFTEGNIPEALIGTPSTWTPDQIRSFQDWFDAMLEGNTAQRSKARFVPGEVSKGFVSTKPDELFGAAEEWLARVVCYAFSVSPQALVQLMNRATAETAQETAQLEGLAPIMKWVKGFMDAILIDDFGEDDLEFAWVEEDELDPDIKSQIIEREQASGRLTMNEARKEQGRDPVNHPDADRPMLKTAAGWVPIFKTPEEEAEAEAMRLQVAGQSAAGDKGGLKPGEVSGKTDPAPGGPKPPSEGDDTSESLGKGVADAGTRFFDDSLSKTDQPRHPKGTSRGGQFKSNRGSVLGIDDARTLGVSDVWAGKLTKEEVQNIRSAIDRGADQEEVLEAMKPIYDNVTLAGEPTLVLGKDGVEPDGFFESRKYRIGGNSEEGEFTSVDGALTHLDEVAVSYAGGQLRRDKEAFLFLGPSAAGKSGFAEEFAKNSGSAIIDSDDAKKVIPGYRGGLGANQVHEESSSLSKIVEQRMLDRGANIVVPTVGANESGIAKRIDRLQKAGYNVTLVDVAVDRHEATRRMASRALLTGRPIGADYVRDVGDRPSATYNALKEKANGYARIEAGGPRGPHRVSEAKSKYFTAGSPKLGKGGAGGGGFRGSLAEWDRTEGGNGLAREGQSQGPQDQLLIKVDIGSPGLYVDPDRPFATKVQKRVYAAFATALRRASKSVASLVVEKLSSSLGKAEDSEESVIEVILRAVELGFIVDLADDLVEDLSSLYSDSALEALAQIGADRSSIVNVVNDRALEWATEHAADLVGTGDDPEFSVTQSTRDMLRVTLSKGIAENLSAEEIGKEVAKSYAFSEERAELIALTEIATANSYGALEGYKEASDIGLEVSKSWLRLGDACPLCVSNAEAGVIPLDDAFPSGDMAPPAHPNCRCVLVPEVKGQLIDGDL